MVPAGVGDGGPAQPARATPARRSAAGRENLLESAPARVGHAGFTLTLFHFASSTRPAGAPRGFDTSRALQRWTSTRGAPRAFEYQAAAAAAASMTLFGTSPPSGFLHDHVAPGRAAGDVKPEVLRLGDVEGEVIVVLLAAPDEDLEAFDDRACGMGGLCSTRILLVQKHSGFGCWVPSASTR